MNNIDYTVPDNLDIYTYLVLERNWDMRALYWVGLCTIEEVIGRMPNLVSFT